MNSPLASLLLELLIEEQARDMEYGHRVHNRPLEILAGLEPAGMLRSRPRYFLSARRIRRRRRSSEVEHGTTAMYKRGCRCPMCSGEQSRRNKVWRATRGSPKTSQIACFVSAPRPSAPHS